MSGLFVGFVGYLLRMTPKGLVRRMLKGDNSSSHEVSQYCDNDWSSLSGLSGEFRNCNGMILYEIINIH